MTAIHHIDFATLTEINYAVNITSYASNLIQEHCVQEMISIFP